MTETPAGRSVLRVLALHPGAELYGSDRMFLESVRAMRAHNWQVDIALAAQGPLVPLLEAEGARVILVDSPVLRKGLLSPKGLASLLLRTPSTLASLMSTIRASAPDVLYVNTVTVPYWVAAARLSGVPVVTHVHEGDEGVSKLVATGLFSALLAAQEIIALSEDTAAYVRRLLPRTASKITVINNTVRLPAGALKPAPRVGPGEPWRLLLVGRLNPRKGQDVAIECVRLLRDRGLDVELTLVGDVYPGYEWFRDDLQRLAREREVADTVTFVGFDADVRPHYDAAHIVLVPSRVEPFGNVAVEAMLRGRPIVVAGIGGLAGIVQAGVVGAVVPAGDAAALADGTARFLDAGAIESAVVNSEIAEKLYSADRYGAAIRGVLRRAAN